MLNVSYEHVSSQELKTIARKSAKKFANRRCKSMSDRDVPSLLTPRPTQMGSTSGAVISPPDPNFLYLYDTVPTLPSTRQLFSIKGEEYPPTGGVSSVRGDTALPSSSMHTLNPKTSLSPRLHDAIAQQSAALSATTVPVIVPDDIPKDDLLGLYKKLQMDFLNLKNMSVSSLSYFQSDLEVLIDEMQDQEKAKRQAEQQVQELNSLLQETRERERSTQQELVAARDALRLQKDTLLESLQLDRMEVADEEFALLATRPVDALTLQERVQQKVWSLVHSVRATAAATSEHVRELTAKSTLQTQQLAQKQRIITEQETELKALAERVQQQRNDYETRCARLNALLSEAHTDMASMTDKARRYDDALAKATSLEEEVSRLRYEAGEREARTRTLVERSEAIVAREHESEQRIRLLAMDKEHLSRECADLREEVARLRREAAHARERAEEAARQREEAQEALVRAQMEARTGLEERVAREVERVSARAEQDLTMVRRLQQEAYEREVSGLRYDKEDLQRQVRALTEELRELRRAKEEGEREARSERALLDSQLSEVNAMARVKTAEYVQMSATYDEVSSELRRTRVELEVAQEKVRAVKEEYLGLREECTRRETQMRATEKSLRERLQAYAVLEQDLDLAILNAGGEAATLLSGGSVLGDNALPERVVVAKDGSALATNAAFASAERIRAVDSVLGVIGQSAGGAEHANAFVSDETSSTDYEDPRVVVPSIYKTQAPDTRVGVNTGVALNSAAVAGKGLSRGSVSRLRQSLLLAHSLVEKQGEIDKLSRELSEAHSLNTRLQQELMVIRAAAQRSTVRKGAERVDAALREALSGMDGEDPRRAEILRVLSERRVDGGDSSTMQMALSSAEAQLDGAADACKGAGLLHTVEHSPADAVYMVEHARLLAEEVRQKDLVLEELRTRVLLLEREKRDLERDSRDLQGKFAKEVRELVGQQHAMRSLRELLGRLLKSHGHQMSREELTEVADVVRNAKCPPSSGVGHHSRDACNDNRDSARSARDSRSSRQDNGDARVQAALEFALRKAHK